MTEDGRRYLLEQIDDAAVVQLYADGFAALTLREKRLVWHLYLAALAGRDIYYDQRYAHNLEMREVLEGILTNPQDVDPQVLAEVRRYTKLFWINTGPYNNITARKFVLRLSPAELKAAMHAAARTGASFPARAGESLDAMVDRMAPLFFDASVDPVVTNKTPGPGRDILQSSANNLYDDVSMAEVERFAERHPLNSRLVKRDGQLVEEVYRVGGRYDRQIRDVIRHLRAAIDCAPPRTAEALRALIRFYETGEDRDRIAYDIAWVQDQDATVDTMNGFIEVYLDPRGVKGAWQGGVYFVNVEKTNRIQALAASAGWFEERMPWEARFRKRDVRGVTARVVDAVVETGDVGPITPLGVNLPNDQAIREAFGSKSISLSNVAEAYEEATPESMRAEFSWAPEETARAKAWGALAQELTTEMHEVIGHGSGRMAEGVTAQPHALLKEHYSAIEETRADLVALYFLPDPKLAELSIVDGGHQEEIVRAEYEGYARRALLQLRRVREGTQLEEDHMRNRQLIVHWLMAHTVAIDVRRRDGKTFYVVVDVQAFRDGVGRLLADVQRIKGDGDYEAARALVDEYGVHFDPALRDEIVRRVDALRLPSYTGIVMPRLSARYDARGAIEDVEIAYPCDLETQMLEYSAFSRDAVAPSAARR